MVVSIWEYKKNVREYKGYKEALREYKKNDTFWDGNLY